MHKWEIAHLEGVPWDPNNEAYMEIVDDPIEGDPENFEGDVIFWMCHNKVAEMDPLPAKSLYC